MVIYTDGSCSGNPGPGGFGVVVTRGDKVIRAYRESHPDTTNNRMEMMAILWAMENYGNEENFFIPIVYSDSSYAINCFTEWIDGWKRNGWTRAKGKKIENLDLIMRYDEMRQAHPIELRKVKGHDGNEFNELADALATGRVKEVYNIE